MIISKLNGKSLYSIWHTLSKAERQSCVKQIASILKEFNKQDYNFLSEEYKDLDWIEYLSKELKSKLLALTEMGFDTEDIDAFIIAHSFVQFNTFSCIFTILSV